MDQPFTIRSALPADLAQLLALYRHLNPLDKDPPFDLAAQRLAQLQALDGSTVLIGLTESSVVATCTLVVIPNLTRAGRPYGLIENVVTDAAFRGRGYGKQILQAAVTSAWQADCYKVMLMTGSKEPSTLGFYASAGFEQSKTGFQIRRLPPRAEAAD